LNPQPLGYEPSALTTRPWFLAQLTKLVLLDFYLLLFLSGIGLFSYIKTVKENKFKFEEVATPLESSKGFAEPWLKNIGP
jgi:hypothetical protein